LQSQGGVRASVVLSTCNRVEFYVVAPSAAPVEQFLLEHEFLTPPELSRLLYVHVGLDAVRHLLEVAASIDSMVVGEAEILGQVKEAYKVAADTGTTDSWLNVAFQEAFRTAGQIRSQTSIGQGRTSVGSVAVGLAEKVFGTLDGRSALVVGTGKMAEGALRALLDAGVRAPVVVSRTLERATEIARRYDGRPLAMGELDAALPQADLILVSTRAPHYLLRPDHLRRALRQRRNEPIFIIDISVPRNVDPAVNELDNVYLSNIDELQQMAAENVAERGRELAQCRRMIEDAAQRSYARIRSLEAGQVAASLRASFEKVRQEELERLFGKLHGLSDAQRHEVQRMTERFQNRLLHEPLSAVRQEAAKGSRLLLAIKRLFGLD